MYTAHHGLRPCRYTAFACTCGHESQSLRLRGRIDRICLRLVYTWTDKTLLEYWIWTVAYSTLT